MTKAGEMLYKTSDRISQQGLPVRRNSNQSQPKAVDSERKMIDNRKNWQENLVRGIQIQRKVSACPEVIQCAKLPNPDILADEIEGLNNYEISPRILNLLESYCRDIYPDPKEAEDKSFEMLDEISTDFELDIDKYAAFCEKEENKAIVYGNAADAETNLRDEDVFIDAANDALTTLNSMEPVYILNVFRTETGQAITNYENIGEKIKMLQDNVKTKVSVDYNGDDEEVGQGGYAVEKEQRVHFSLENCNGSNEGQLTIIHECAHLVDPNIKDDGGYKESNLFEWQTDEMKVHNAAHYEVAPGWELKMFKEYGEVRDFVPRKFEGEGGLTNEQLGRNDAYTYFQKAWEYVLFLFEHLRKLYVTKEDISSQREFWNQFSKALKLTIHLRDNARITLLDVTLMQNLTHVMAMMLNDVSDFPVLEAAVECNAEDYEEFFIDAIMKKDAPNWINREMVNTLYESSLVSAGA